MTIAAALLMIGALGAGVRGVRLFARGVRRADDPCASLWVIRGIRGVVVALAATAAAGGLLFDQHGWLVLAGVFAGEELYETGVVALVLRASSTQTER